MQFSNRKWNKHGHFLVLLVHVHVKFLNLHLLYWKMDLIINSKKYCEILNKGRLSCWIAKNSNGNSSSAKFSQRGSEKWILLQFLQLTTPRKIDYCSINFHCGFFYFRWYVQRCKIGCFVCRIKEKHREE